jgi:hypothetical protein
MTSTTVPVASIRKVNDLTSEPGEGNPDSLTRVGVITTLTTASSSSRSTTVSVTSKTTSYEPLPISPMSQTASAFACRV